MLIMAPTTRTNAILVYIIVSTWFIYTTKSQFVTCPTEGTECHCPPASTPGETCILDCSVEDSCKSTSLYCRADDPCAIRCQSKAACSVALHIEATTATNVNLICNGEDTCKSSNILKCGTGDCKISCNGEASCESFGLIDVTHAKSFECIGQCSFPNKPKPFNLPSLNPTAAPIDNQYSNNFKPNTVIEAVITTLTPTIAPTSMRNGISVKSTHDVHVSGFGFSAISSVHPLYYVIVILLVSICVVCCILFCWVFVSHSHTQKLITEQEKRLDSKSVNFNSSQLNVPNSSYDVNSNILTPTCMSVNITASSNMARIYRVRSADSAGDSTPNTVELQQHDKSNQIAPIAEDNKELNEMSDSETSVSTDTSKSNSPLTEGFTVEEANTGISYPTTTITTTNTNTNTNTKPKLLIYTPAQNIYDLFRKEQVTSPNNTSLPGKYSQTNLIQPLETHPLYNQNFRVPPPPPPPPPLPDTSNSNQTYNMPQPPSVSIPIQIQIHPTVLRKSNIPPPPHTDSDYYYNTSENITSTHVNNDQSCDQLTQDVTHTHTETYIENSSDDLSDDTILKHLNTIDSDMEYGEEDAHSMKAVRHPTLSIDTCNVNTPSISPQITIQIKSPNGLSKIDLKKDNMEQTMQNIKQEIIEIVKQNKSRNMEDKIGMELVEIQEENSNSLRSCSFVQSQHTSVPKEFEKECMSENSENDRNSYAVRIISIDEPTFTDFKSHSKTNSTLVDDTYLKYLNM